MKWPLTGPETKAKVAPSPELATAVPESCDQRLTGWEWTHYSRGIGSPGPFDPGPGFQQLRWPACPLSTDHELGIRECVQGQSHWLSGWRPTPRSCALDLREAHERSDEVLERIHIGRRFRNDTERLERLFELYTKMTAGAGAKEETKRWERHEQPYRH